MHDCEEFRERITEYIIDREDIAAKAEFQRELLICARCSEFYAEASEMMEALSAIDFTISETQWKGIQHRLQARILNMPPLEPVVVAETPARPRAVLKTEAPARTRRIMIPVWV